MTTDYILGIYWVLRDYIPAVPLVYTRDWSYAKSMSTTHDWMDEIPPTITPRKKRTRSVYRDQKESRHVTRGGKGVVARPKEKQ